MAVGAESRYFCSQRKFNNMGGPNGQEFLVRAFSRTKAGRKYMPRPIKIEMIQDMLKGFRDTADIARNLIVVNSKKEDEYVHVDNEATTIPAGAVSLR